MTHQPYPRSLYRQRDDIGPDFEFDGVRCEMLTVDSEEEEADAKADGWHNSPAEAGKASDKPKGGDPSADAKPDPLDHDGDGRKGGSKKGKASTRSKGAAKGRK